MFTFDDSKSADTGTDEYACTLRQIPVNRQVRLFHRTFGGGNRVMDERVHFLDVFFLEPAERIEVFDLGGDLGGKLRGIETGDSGDAAAPFAQAFPRVFSSRSQRRYQTDARDRKSTLLQNTTSFTRSFLPPRACAARTAPTS